MYISYVFNWLYRIMQAPVPLVASSDVYGLVTVFDLFLFSVYCGIFIVLIRYIVTDNLSLQVGDITDFTYSSSAYLPTRIMQIGKNRDNKPKENIVAEKRYRSKPFIKKNFNNSSMGGRIINAKRDKFKILNRNSMGHRIIINKVRKDKEN